MKRLTDEQRRKELEAIAALPEDQIKTADIPELTLEQLRRGVRGQMYRPIKRPVTMRLDADVIEWLKRDGPGYQTKANCLLRAEMLRSYRGVAREEGRISQRGGNKQRKPSRAAVKGKIQFSR